MSAYLKKSIATIVAALALGTFTGSLNADTGTMSTVTAIGWGWDNPYDVSNQYFGWSDNDYLSWYDSVSDSSGGGYDDPSPPVTPCDEIRRVKPDSCPNPIPLPNGFGFGRDNLYGGTAIPKILYFIEHRSGVDAQARQIAQNGLDQHTRNLTDEFTSDTLATERLLMSIQLSCKLQQEAMEPLRESGWLIGVSPQERDCIEMLEVLRAEAGDPGFTRWFSGWLGRKGVELSDLGIPQTVLNQFSPPSSLSVKGDLVRKDSKCAKWWALAQENHCPL